MSEQIDFGELRESAAALLTAECSGEAVHRFIDGDAGLTDTLWRTVAELGWQGLAVPEAYGGLGLDPAAPMALYYELGRHCAPLPLLGSLLVAEALASAGDEALRQQWLPRLATGEVRGAVADLARAPALTATGAAPVLAGEVHWLPEAAGADLLLVSAQGEQGLEWLLMEPAADGLALERQDTVDPTRHFASIAPGGLALPAERRLAAGPAAVALREQLLDHAALALACDSIGGAEAAFAQTIDYLKTRRQFGRLIGSFQALKHRCADLKVLLEAASATTARAVRERGQGADARALAAAASMAKSHAADAYARIAGEAMQLHGGIGFTWEHDCHLFLKRAKLNQSLHGDSHWHRDRVARALLAAA